MVGSDSCFATGNENFFQCLLFGKGDFGQPTMRNERERSSHPGRKLVTFKSDVASAFLNLPAHPLSIIIFLLFAVSSLEIEPPLESGVRYPDSFVGLLSTNSAFARSKSMISSL